MSLRDGLALATVVLVWGLNVVVVRIGVQEIPPLFLAALRFTLVGLLLAPFFRPARADLAGVTALSLLLGVGHFGLMFVGLRGVEAATASIAIQLGVPISALLARVMFGERLGWAGVLGMALAFTGVGLLAGEPSLTGVGPLLIVVLSMTNWALSNVLVKRLRTVGPLVLNGWVSLLAVPWLLALSALFEHGQAAALAAATWRGWGAVAFTALGASIVAYTLWYHLIATHPVNKVVPVTLLSPVIGMAGGILVLGEAPTWHKLVGGALTVAGVAIIELRRGGQR